jgi:hypothetical protein
MHTTHHPRQRTVPFDASWEYKIVRARNGEFGQRHHLEALLQQEALAGWEIVAKYNDSQVRLKRPRSARAWDDALPPYIDPYRTVYIAPSTNDTLHAIILTISLIFAVIVIAVLGILASLPS